MREERERVYVWGGGEYLALEGSVEGFVVELRRETLRRFCVVGGHAEVNLHAISQLPVSKRVLMRRMCVTTEMVRANAAHGC